MKHPFQLILLILTFQSCGNLDQETTFESEPEKLEENKIKSIQYYNNYGSTFEYYDTLGNKTLTYEIDSLNDTIKTIKYLFDEKFRLTKEIVIKQNNDTSEVCLFVYEDGSKNYTQEYKSGNTKFFFDDKDNLIANSSRYANGVKHDTNSFWYNSENLCITRIYHYGGEKETFQYDSNGNISKSIITIDSNFLDNYHTDIENPARQELEYSYVLNEYGDWEECTIYIISEPFVNGEKRLWYNRKRKIEYY